MGLTRVFDIARRSLATYQNAMDVTSHNIANAGNADYSRQRVIFAAENPEANANFVWGAGVKIQQVQRVRDTLTDTQIRINNSKNANYNKQSELLSQVEEIFSEPSDIGLSSLMSEFFTSWNELASSPNSLPLRDQVVSNASQLASKVKSIHDDIDLVKTDIMNEFRQDVDSVNSMLNQIQSLNKQIFETKTIGNQPNDLEDQRDTLIDQLSKLVNISVNTDSQGTPNISIGGISAADLSIARQFKFDIQGGKLLLVADDGTKTIALSGGEMSALSDLYSTTLPGYQDKLDTLIETMVKNVNDLHKTGYDLQDPPVTGTDFFSSYSAANGKLTINPAIVADSRLIAASADGTSGNGDIATAIYNIMDTKSADLDGSTLPEYYAELVSEVGNRKKSADMNAESSQMVIDQLNQTKASYSGVSTDEEMTNIIKFQRSYDASAKLIQVADDMLKTLINLVQ